MQGLIGWWMVKSGLDAALLQEKVRDSQEIRVSPYRLATHLSMAFTTFALLVWTGLDCVNSQQVGRVLAELRPSLTPDHIRRFVGLRKGAIVNFGLVLCTAISGAFVAGNDAGKAYNNFPYMGDSIIPPSDVLFELQPLYRNFFENTATVQLDHRVLALSTLASVWGMYLPLYLRSKAKVAAGSSGVFQYKSLPRTAQLGLTAMTHATAVQVGLGIATLMNYVPVSLAILHQVIRPLTILIDVTI